MKFLEKNALNQLLDQLNEKYPVLQNICLTFTEIQVIMSPIKSSHEVPGNMP